MSKTRDGKPISTNYIKKFLKEASKLNVDERMVTYKIREDRADVLVPALTIFSNVLTWSDIFDEFSLRHDYLMCKCMIVETTIIAEQYK